MSEEEEDATGTTAEGMSKGEALAAEGRRREEGWTEGGTVW